MKRNYRLLFGPLAGGVLFVGIIGLALMVPGYNQVRQTVSEIGEVGSRARVPFAIMLCCVAACLVVFASAVRELSVKLGHSQLAAYFIGYMALPAAGIGIFAYPHPLHNVFGLSELIGYQAPLILSLTWRRDPQAKALVTFSWVMFGIILVVIRKACLWPRSESTICRLVCLVRRGRGAPVSAQVPGRGFLGFCRK